MLRSHHLRLYSNTQRKTLIPHDSKWKYTNMNPSAPTIKGLIKIHKPGHPVRPIVNWRNTPAYKLARLLTYQIRQLAPLPHTYNIYNTTDLINKLKNIPPLPHYTLASLDITDLYTNVPVNETRNIHLWHTRTTATKPPDQTGATRMVWHHPSKLLLQQWRNSDPRRRPCHGSTHFRPLAGIFPTTPWTHPRTTPIKHKIVKDTSNM